MPPIDSRHIANVEYDEEFQALTIDFVKGGSYKYLNVPQYVYDNFFLADSPSEYFRSTIKDFFEVERQA